MNDIKTMNRAADNIRILAASMVEKAKSGHPGGAMGGADFINVLYSEFLEYDPLQPEWIGRDRFFLDPGHMAPMLYAQLALIGKFTLAELQQLRQWGSPTPGHPEVDVARGIENSSGPLRQGHAYAVGAAIAAKFLAAHTGNPTFSQETIYAYISDGGIQEEISQGTARIAGQLGLDNLIMFYDSNDIQLSTETKVVMNEDTALKFRAVGWEVFEINGNDVEQIREAIRKAKVVKGKPSLIIGKCIMGKGALQSDGSSYERNCKTHGAPLGGEAFRNTIQNLGGDPDEPFQIFPEVQALYATRMQDLRSIVAARHQEENAWAESDPAGAERLKAWFSKKAPQVDWSQVIQKDGDATRNASAACLGVSAEKMRIAEKTGRRISFEYAMIDGVNDSPAQARLLAKHARAVAAHVNLIPLNHVEERQFQPSTPEHMKNFIQILEDAGVNVTVRRRLGSDVDASCGQLRRKMQAQNKGKGGSAEA